MKSNALTTFERRLERIRSLIRCADVYCLHALAQLRDEQPDLSLIEKIIREGVHSALNWSTGLFMTREEEKVFIEEGPLKAICDQIVFASYVAIEDFLVAKFKEYYAHKLSILISDIDDYLDRNNIYINGLENIAKRYIKLLDFNIREFDHPQVAVHAEAKWFQPDTCWDGVKKLSMFRNGIAHAKYESRAGPNMLVDAHSVVEFCRRYAVLFDYYYDAKCYHAEYREN